MTGKNGVLAERFNLLGATLEGLLERPSPQGGRSRWRGTSQGREGIAGWFAWGGTWPRVEKVFSYKNCCMQVGKIRQTLLVG